MTRKLVVFDVDSTLIENEVIELLARKAGTHEMVADVTQRAMAGEIDFAESLRQRVATLAGVPATVLSDVLDEIVVTPGAIRLIDRIHRNHGLVAAVSGGFIEILDVLAPQLDVNLWKANRLGAENGVLTGFVVGDIIDARAKAEALTEWAREYEISTEDTVAIGDGANDLEMMAAAGTSIAFCAKPIVVEAADHSITQRDLSLAIDVIYPRS